MTKPSITQSQKRFQESVGALFSEATETTAVTGLFLKSSSDQGVIRNGGRNGSRFAPQSLLFSLKRLTQSSRFKQMSFKDIEVADPQAEKENFHKAQLEEASRISQALRSHQASFIFHLGGGHDHIFPLLMAFKDLFPKVIVINVDAHADTRTDPEYHSGTPFRQFSQQHSGEFHLFQIGLHPYANSFSTLDPLPRIEQKVLWKSELNPERIREFFEHVSRELSKSPALVVFSLDADALSGQSVPGVSAVNPDGLELEGLRLIWDEYRRLKLPHSPVVGIYELNPVYDTLASISMRTMAGFIFEAIK